MSRQRRQEERRQRQRQRRSARGSNYEPAGNLEFGGVMGFFQRHGRWFFIFGIVIMIVSLGAVFFPTNQPIADLPPTPTADADATETATAEATSSPEASPTPADGIQRTYSAPPEMAINPTAAYEAIIRTERGDVHLELLADEAPGYVNNFVFLARNRFFEGLTFHRVEPGFVVQAGDPTATGLGGPGYWLPEETTDEPFDAGVLSMAKAGTDVSGSQFFITLGPTPALADDFTVFGRVTEGLELLQAFDARDPSAAGQPPGVRILGIEIIETE